MTAASPPSCSTAMATYRPPAATGSHTAAVRASRTSACPVMSAAAARCVIRQAADNWEKLSKAGQEQHLKAPERRQAKIDGLNSVDLANMKDGNGCA